MLALRCLHHRRSGRAPPIPAGLVTNSQAAFATYTGSLGFHPLFGSGDVASSAHVARDEAILAIRHVGKPVIDYTAGDSLLSAFIESRTSTTCTNNCTPQALASGRHFSTSRGPALWAAAGRPICLPTAVPRQRDVNQAVVARLIG